MMKKHDNQYVTSSLHVWQYGSDPGLVNLRTGQRFDFVDESVLEIIFFFLRPQSLECIPENMSADAVDVCIQEGFIVPVTEGLSIWQRYGWQRAAQLLFSHIKSLS